MSLALYMDHHIKASITSGLRQRGLDVLTAEEVANQLIHLPL